MTATTIRPPVDDPSPPRDGTQRTQRNDDPTATRRTLRALFASALAVFPLKGLFSDYGWLIDVWLSMVVVMGPAILLRMRRAPGAADIWPGIVLLVPWLTVRFLPQHAFAGLIPTGASTHDLSLLMDSLHHTTTQDVAPLHSTPAVRLVLCALLGLLAALIDLIAVVGHRGALAGVPLLVVYTIAGAVPREPVSWVWFIGAGAAYLLLLSVDSDEQLTGWGRRIGRPADNGVARARLAVPVSAQRIGITAILVAIVLPLVVPDQPRNLIANAFHNGHGGSGNRASIGFGAGSSINPFVKLKGELNRDKPIDLMRLHIDGIGANRPPFYLRSNVLSKFTGSGWTAEDRGPSVSIENQDFRSDPDSPQPSHRTYAASIRVLRDTDSPAIFGQPIRVGGLDGSTKWNPRDQILIGPDVQAGAAYDEAVSETTATQQQLEAVQGNPVGMSRWLQLPAIPPSVSKLVTSILDKAKATTPYEKTRALHDYFTDPANDFQYSLRTKTGDSGSDLVDFLKNRAGFCQQYAAAMAAMLRLAKVPSRVVLGYMLDPDTEHAGDYAVTSFDAHAWVEAYFQGYGWIPFDPTPISGLDGGAPSDLGYAPHPAYSANPNDPRARASGGGSSSPNAPSTSLSTSKSSAPIAAPTATSSNRTPLWVLLASAGVLLIVLIPGGIRSLRRRRRFASGQHGDPNPLWAELSDTVVDLGYVWSPARTPRQVAAWLAHDSRHPDALSALAAAVEEHRYGPDVIHDDSGELARGLRQVIVALRSGRSGRTRLRSRLWPASLRLGSSLPGPRRH